MPLTVRYNGTWRTVVPYVRVGGVWRNALVHARTGGTWRAVSDLVQIQDELIFASGVGSASAEYELSHTGDIFRIVNSMPTDIGDWITPKVRMSDYECRATLVSGSLSSGTTGTWLSLSQRRQWTLFRFVSGPQTTVLQIEIRRAADQVVLDSAQITLQVLVEE